jgi:DNA (cytosine-5)-methyltransferase 1
MGLHRAGFDVVGVDIDPQPRYPFEFHQADAMTFPLDGFDFIWASPPCQRFSALATREDLSGYPDLIDPIRQRLIDASVPWCIENVPGAPVRKDLLLCGGMFGLRSYRHRHFECSFQIKQPEHPKHTVRVNRRGENRREHWARGGFMTITGDVGVYCGPEAMGIDWMSGNEMSEAIPPAYAEYIGLTARLLITKTNHDEIKQRLSRIVRAAA